MSLHPTVTLTSDFGTRDSYVGQMKGAALRVEPSLSIVDLCHEIPAQDVAAGSYVLETGYAAFPDGTIHVAVVDPGVGTDRRALAVRTDRYVFVGPDNGLFTRVLEHESVREAHLLQEPAFRLAGPGTTFDGRDLFAPAAAWIARGTPLQRFGPPAGELATLPRLRPVLAPGTDVIVQVLVVDRFGNVVIDVTEDALRQTLAEMPSGQTGTTPVLLTPAGQVARWRTDYADNSAGPFLLINSAGYVEVAVAGASAARLLGLHPGTEVEFRLP